MAGLISPATPLPHKNKHRILMLGTLKKRLKKVDPLRRTVQTVKRGKRSFVSFVEARAARYAVRSPFLSSMYYAFTGRFGREHQSVLSGRLKHAEKKNNLASARFLLRRSVHRLEKGLLMRPRRDIFALSYIEEAVGSYEKVVCDETGAADRRELEWAEDVFDEYFRVVGGERAIERAEAVYRACRRDRKDSSSEGGGKEKKSPILSAAVSSNTESSGRYEEVKAQDATSDGEQASRRIPYLRAEKKAPVSYDALWKLSRHRRSVRWFEQKPVPRRLIDKAVRIAAQSPSACNRLPYEFRLFDDPKLIAEAAAMPKGTRGYRHNIPTLAVVVGRQRAYSDERDRHLIYIDGSLAAMSFMYALESIGLSSCPINWPDIEEREAKMADFLDLDPDERPIMLVAIGYPDPEGQVAYSQKKSLDDLRTYNKTGAKS